MHRKKLYDKTSHFHIHYCMCLVRDIVMISFYTGRYSSFEDINMLKISNACSTKGTFLRDFVEILKRLMFPQNLEDMFFDCNSC